MQGRLKIKKGVKMVKVFIAVLVVTIALIVVFQVIDPSVDTSGGEQTTLVSDTNTISVSISGEVSKPGTYLMEPNTYLVDLISVAGGVTNNADELAYDTSYLLADSLSFYIAPKFDNNDVCSMSPIVKVNINNDSAEQLQTISGIGSTVANQIVNYRTTNGKFYRIEDVKNVSGIGNATFEKIKNYITLR